MTVHDESSEPNPDVSALADVVGSADIDPHDVLVVGEYTTDSGPYSDDYFLVLILRSGKDVEIPMGRADHVLRGLERLTSTRMPLKLANRTDFTSRVMYPPNLLDRPLYEFSREPVGPGIWRRICDRIVPTVRSTLTEEVARYVRGRQTPPGV